MAMMIPGDGPASRDHGTRFCTLSFLGRTPSRDVDLELMGSHRREATRITGTTRLPVAAA